MFGLRPDVDQVPLGLLGKGNGKSYKFAERNNGRFFVSGVSGSFQKFTKEKEVRSKKVPRTIDKIREQSREMSIDRLAENTDAEMMRLHAMEKRLEELRWEKEQRRIRERARRQRKVIFISVCKIQQAWKRYRRNNKKEACTIIASFIKTLGARQALAAAAWSARVIRNFAERCTARFILRKKRNEREKRYIQITNEIAAQLVTNLLESSLLSETSRLLLFKKYRSPKKGGSPMKSKQQHHGINSNNNSNGNSLNSPIYKQFFLTEFDSSNSGTRGSNSKLSPLTKSKDDKKIKNHAKNLSPEKTEKLNKVDSKSNIEQKKRSNIEKEREDMEKRLQDQEKRRIEAEKLQLRSEQQRKLALLKQQQLEEEEEKKRKKKLEEDELKRQRRKELEEKLRKRKEAEEEEKRRKKRQEAEEEERRKKKENEEDEEERRRKGLLSNKHGERIRTMEEERMRRLSQIESYKAEKERQDLIKREMEAAVIAEKEKKKQDFLNRLEEEQILRARNLAKLREQRLKEEKRIEEERSREAMEIRHMRMEDPNIRAGGLRLKRRILLPNPNADKLKKDNSNDKSKKVPPTEKGTDSEDDDRRIADAREKVKARVAQRLALEKAAKEKEKADVQCRKEQQAKVLAYALKMMKKKSSKKQSNKMKSKKIFQNVDPISNNVNLPIIEGPSPISSNYDQDTNDDDNNVENNDINLLPDDYGEDIVDIDDGFLGEIDDGGFGFDDFMDNALETPWRDSPNSNASNKAKKKNMLSNKDKGKGDKNDLLAMVEKARQKLGLKDNNVVDNDYQQVPQYTCIKGKGSHPISLVTNINDESTKLSSNNLNPNLPLNMFLKAGPIRPFNYNSSDSIKVESKKKKKAKDNVESIPNIKITKSSHDNDKENIINSSSIAPSSSNNNVSTKKKYINSSNIKHAFDYIQPLSNSCKLMMNENDDDEADDSVDAEEEDAYERALNFECELLRSKLAAKLASVSASASNKPNDMIENDINNNQNENDINHNHYINNNDNDNDNIINDDENNSNHDSNNSNNSIVVEEPENSSLDYYFDYDYSKHQNNISNDEDDEDEEAIEKENQLLRQRLENMKRKIIL